MAQGDLQAQSSFEVDWGEYTVRFAEVTGLSMGQDFTDYREAHSNDSSRRAVTGRTRSDTITLKRGCFDIRPGCPGWIEKFANGCSEERRDVTIRLRNERHETVAAWQAIRCLLVNVTALSLKSGAEEAAVESIALMHEGLTLIER